MKINVLLAAFWRRILSRTDHRTVTISLVLLAVVVLIQVSPYWVPIGDGPGYLSIARSIASGDGLTRFGTPHLFFAPGYPAVIAPAFLFSDRPFLLLSVFHWVLLLVFTLGTYVWAKALLPEYALSIAVLSTINVGVMYYFRRTASEAVFMPLLMWGAACLDILVRRNETSRPWMLPLCAIFSAFLCVVRQAGFALTAGFCLMAASLAFAKNLSWRRALYYAVVVGLSCALLGGSLVLYDRKMAAAYGGAAYINEAISANMPLTTQLLEGLRLRIQEIGNLILPGAFKARGGWLNPCMLLYVPLFLVVWRGWFLLVRDHTSALVWAFPFYLGLYIVWPFQQGSRFMTPLVPLFWMALIVVVARSRFKPALPQAIVCAILLGFLTSILYLFHDIRQAHRVARLWTTVDAISARLPKNGRLGTLKASRDLQLMLQVARDRPVRALDDRRLGVEGIDFLLVHPATETVPGFVTIYAHGDYSLHTRDLLNKGR